jgi:SAM-dependent methyltransferase
VYLYDSIGATYTTTRRPDARVGAFINRGLGDARSVINVGAGSGAYEPPQTVLAVEPSTVMIGQRPAGSAPVVQARAEALPIADGAADAALAVLTVHHWEGLEAGLAQLRRIARRRIVILTWDHEVTRDFWLLREYLPEAVEVDQAMAIPVDQLADLLGGARIETMPVPHDCTDGFAAAFWRRPEAYLDPVVRAGISMLAQAGDGRLRAGLVRLAADLKSGQWRARHADLLDREQLDLGYRLLIADR